MKNAITVLIIALFPGMIWAQEAVQTAPEENAAGSDTELAEDSAVEEPGPEVVAMETGDVDISEFLWTKRPVVVFADSPNDPAFIEQMALLDARPETLSERDVIVLTDTDPKAASELRRKFRPRGFMLALIGKDGQIKLRKPLPWDVRELTRVIDKMPMRQREIRERRLEGG